MLLGVESGWLARFKSASSSMKNMGVMSLWGLEANRGAGPTVGIGTSDFRHDYTVYDKYEKMYIFI